MIREAANLRRLFSALLVAGACFASTEAEESIEVDHKPIRVWGAQEMGMLQGGVNWIEDAVMRREWVDHLGAALSKEAVINDRLSLQVGIGGVFQFPKPERTQATFFGSQYKLFYVGPSVAQAVYSFGDLERPWLQLGTGIFPYKYNPDAHNLGEYLFRSTAYPNTMTTGGVTTINQSGSQLQGFKALFSVGSFRFDALFTTETTFPPFYDWSLAGIASYTLGDGLLEIGAGVHLDHLVPIHPDTTTPRILRNAYFNGAVTVPGNTYARGTDTLVKAPDTVTLMLSGEKEYYSKRSSYYGNRAADSDLDFASYAAFAYTRDSLEAIASVVSSLDNTNLDSIGARFYTNQAVLLMGRASLDVKKLFESDLFGPQDLKFYAEVNLLGWQDYPIFYEDKKARMPIMVGFNVPAFKILDLLAVQFEWYDSPYLNNHFAVGNGNVATPTFSSSEIYSPGGYYSVTEDDNLYWSVLLQKQILPGVQFSTQFARDHYRHIAVELFYGSRQEATETLFRKKDWYWMCQLSWGL